MSARTLWVEGWWNVNKWRDYICRMNSWKGRDVWGRVKKSESRRTESHFSPNFNQCIFFVCDLDVRRWSERAREIEGEKKCLLILEKSFYCSNSLGSSRSIDTIEKSTMLYDGREEQKSWNDSHSSTPMLVQIHQRSINGAKEKSSETRWVIFIEPFKWFNESCVHDD